MFGSKEKDEEFDDEEQDEKDTTNNTNKVNENTNTTNSNTNTTQPQKQQNKKPALVQKGQPKKIFELDEKDLEEKFVIGSGPGGQHLNKTSTTCFLKHIPTGILVKCGITRSLVQNRKLARDIMRDKLDFILNGKTSKIEKEREKIRKRKSKRARRGFGSGAATKSADGEENSS